MNRTFAAVLFFVSGLAALAYEIAWIARLELFLGGTTASLGVVLAAYMGGLGLGARLAGRFADLEGAVAGRYLRLELGLALLGFTMPWLLGGIESIYVALHGAGGIALKALLSLLALLPATLLMGATLPVVARAAVHREAEAQGVVARLYGWNTLGAVAGALLAHFWALNALGLSGSSRALALVNLSLAAAAWLGRRWLGRVTHGDGERGESLPASASRRRALWLAATAGALGLSLEIALSRALGMALGSTRHGFAIVLVSILCGIGLGSLWAERLKLVRDQLQDWAARAFAWIAIATGLVLWLHPKLLRALFHLTQPRALDYETLLVAQFVLCALLVLPAALALGALFPLLTRWATTDTGHGATTIGSVYLCNSLGAVAGSLLCGLWLLPALGASWLLRCLGIAACVAAALTLRGSRPIGRTTWLLGLLALAAIALPRNWDPSRLDLNPTRLRNGPLPDERGEYEDAFANGGLALLMAEEGRDAYVSVRGSGNITQLKIGGKTDASTPNDMATQLLLGAVPFLARPDAARVGVIGLGAGVTAAVASGYPEVELVDVMEIEPAVVRAAREHFASANHRVLEDVRVRLVIDDARSALRRRIGEPYDVLISEPSNPSIAGIANLFSVEHYRVAKASLAEDGVYLQWIQLYETDDWMLRSMVLSFLEEFAFVDFWWAYPSDLLLLGSERPLRYDRARAAAAAAENPILQAELWEHLQALDAIEIFSRYLAPASELGPLFARGEALHDERPHLAARAARNRYEGTPPFALLRQLWQHVSQRPSPWPALAEIQAPSAEEDERLHVAAGRYLETLSPEIARAFLADAQTPEAFALRARLATSGRERQAQIADGLQAYPEHPLLFLELARLHLDAGDRETASQILEELRLPERWMDGRLTQARLRAVVVEDAASGERAAELASQLLRALPAREESRSSRIYALDRLIAAAASSEAAVEALRAARVSSPLDAEVALALAEAEWMRGRARLALDVLDAADASNHLRWKAEWRRLRVLILATVDLEAAQQELGELLLWFPEQARHPRLQQLLAAR